jgi:hypothetical protein
MVYHMLSALYPSMFLLLYCSIVFPAYLPANMLLEIGWYPALRPRVRLSEYAKLLRAKRAFIL